MSTILSGTIPTIDTWAGALTAPPYSRLRAGASVEWPGLLRRETRVDDDVHTIGARLELELDAASGPSTLDERARRHSQGEAVGSRGGSGVRSLLRGTVSRAEGFALQSADFFYLQTLVVVDQLRIDLRQLLGELSPEGEQRLDRCLQLVRKLESLRCDSGDVWHDVVRLRHRPTATNQHDDDLVYSRSSARDSDDGRPSREICVSTVNGPFVPMGTTVRCGT